MVQVQTRPLTTMQYLRMPESETKEELDFGWIVREPLGHVFWHQRPLSRLNHLLYKHVEMTKLGDVISGAGIILDQQKALVLAPDISVVLHDRLRILKGQLTAPPNLVIEVASPSTQKRDRDKKVGWYREYGVQECWLVDTRKRIFHVFHFWDASMPDGQIMQGDDIVESRVLPDFRHSVNFLLGPPLDEPPPDEPMTKSGLDLTAPDPTL